VTDRPDDDGTEIDDDEVAAQSAEELPDREAMSIVRPPGPPGLDAPFDAVLRTGPQHP
jgi:hypothetical protein